MRRFVVMLTATGDIYVEKVNLVVAANLIAVRVVHHRSSSNTPVVARSQRNGSSNDPHAQPAGRGGQKVLYGLGTRGFADRPLVDIPRSHDCEVFRQYGQTGP